MAPPLVADCGVGRLLALVLVSGMAATRMALRHTCMPAVFEFFAMDGVAHL